MRGDSPVGVLYDEVIRLTAERDRYRAALENVLNLATTPLCSIPGWYADKLIEACCQAGVRLSVTRETARDQGRRMTPKED